MIFNKKKTMHCTLVHFFLLKCPTKEFDNKIPFLNHSTFPYIPGTHLAEITLERLGTYGDIQLLWRSGLPANQMPAGFIQGAILPDTDVVRMNHGQRRKSFYVQVFLLFSLYRFPFLFLFE